MLSTYLTIIQIYISKQTKGEQVVILFFIDKDSTLIKIKILTLRKSKL